jgi:hypothetical protein
LATRGQQANQISDVAIPAYGAVVLQRVDGTYNQPPVVVITPSQPVAKINTNLTLSAAQSTDADGTIANYLWTTGETTPSISVRYTKGGFKSVGVTVTDNGGAKTTAYTTIDIDDGIPRSTFPSLNFRGSANGWSNTPMSLIANNLWSAPITFVGQTEQSFKFDVAGDWINTYGDSNADGIVERMGGDIRATVQGNYFVRLNDATMKYSLVSADNENKPPVAVITPKTPVVGINQTLTLSAQDSSDPDGQIVSYLWSTGESTPTINISYPTGGFKTLSVTVTDNGGYRNTISTTVDVDDGSLRSNFTSLNFRGTANNWLATPMTLT